MSERALRQAQVSQKDEFYTQLRYIEQELINYRDYFEDKVVFCNCDDPEESNFWLYFTLSFDLLKLKKLVATHYDKDKPTYKLEIIRGKKDVVKTKLQQNGDFRSPECIEILKKADIVVTNPPFSLFREYVAQLIEYNKKFIIIGNTNSFSYKEVFHLFKDDKIRTGYTNFNVGMFFYVPDDYPKWHKIEDGRKVVRVSTSCWLTNLPVKKHMENVVLYQKYSPDNYPKYANFDAINVNDYRHIPYDYNGIMGVPITFIDKWNPDQFEIIGLGISNSGLEIGVQPYKPEHRQYRREVERKGAVDGDLYMLDENGHPKVPYARILIRRKASEDEK